MSAGAEPSQGSTEQVRREKLERLRAEGIDPYPPQGWPDRDKIAAIHEAHDPEPSWRRASRPGTPTGSPAAWSATAATARRSSSTSAT